MTKLKDFLLNEELTFNYKTDQYYITKNWSNKSSNRDELTYYLKKDKKTILNNATPKQIEKWIKLNLKTIYTEKLSFGSKKQYEIIKYTINFSDILFNHFYTNPNQSWSFYSK